MNSSNEPATSYWGAELAGHEFDLADWTEALRTPSDPWVERNQGMCVLRSLAFDDLQSSADVRERAEALVDQLNGAMAATRASRPVRVNDVVKFDPDGSRHFHMEIIEGLE